MSPVKSEQQCCTFDDADRSKADRALSKLQNKSHAMANCVDNAARSMGVPVRRGRIFGSSSPIEQPSGRNWLNFVAPFKLMTAKRRLVSFPPDRIFSNARPA